MKKQVSLTGSNRGSVLVVCLFIIFLMSLFGMIALNATNSELKAAGEQKVAMQSFFAAESGFPEAMRRLREKASSADYLGDTAALIAPDCSAYILTSDSWSPSDDPYFDATLSNYIPTASDFTNLTHSTRCL